MLIGVPKEIKNHEYRVGLVPETVRELSTVGHSIVVEHDAGLGIGVDSPDKVEIVTSDRDASAYAERLKAILA